MGRPNASEDVRVLEEEEEDAPKFISAVYSSNSSLYYTEPYTYMAVCLKVGENTIELSFCSRLLGVWIGTPPRNGFVFSCFLLQETILNVYALKRGKCRPFVMEVVHPNPAHENSWSTSNRYFHYIIFEQSALQMSRHIKCSRNISFEMVKQLVLQSLAWWDMCCSFIFLLLSRLFAMESRV